MRQHSTQPFMLSSHSLPEQSPIASFPTSNQPVMDTLLKEMLLLIHNSLHADILNPAKHISNEVHALGDRVHCIEESMGEMTTTINDLVDAHDKGVEERMWLKVKFTDLEDRFRRNNLKLRGISESV